jgi:hypothetical protein
MNNRLSDAESIFKEILSLTGQKDNYWSKSAQSELQAIRAQKGK